MNTLEKLPVTNVTAELIFSDNQQAELFAKSYTRKTLMGHSVHDKTVKIYNVTNDIKQWITDYVKEVQS